jgi:hypothetical protein
MSYEKLVSSDIHIEVLIILIFRSNYINFYEIMCSYEAQNVEKHNFLNNSF